MDMVSRIMPRRLTPPSTPLWSRTRQPIRRRPHPFLPFLTRSKPRERILVVYLPRLDRDEIDRVCDPDAVARYSDLRWRSICLRLLRPCCERFVGDGEAWRG